MEIQKMGRVVTEATVENLEDIWKARRGAATPEAIRRISIPAALVDTGATLLSLPTSLIRELGIQAVASKRVTSSAGVKEAMLFDAVRLTIQGRSCTVDVLEVPDGVPTLIGQIPLEHLDFTVDLRGQKLVGNPEHGGEHMYEMY